MRAVKSFLLRHQSLLLLAARAYGFPRGSSVRRRLDGAWIISRGRQEIWVAGSHAPYIRDVIREFDYYFTAVEAAEIDGHWVVDCTQPRMQQLDGLDQPILITGLPEPNATNQTYADVLALPEGGVVIDGGAYCGASSLLFAQLVGEHGRVIAVEADPSNFTALRANTQEFSNIIQVPVALWSEAGIVTFASEGNMGSAVQVSGGEVRPGGTRVEVQAVTVEELVNRHGLERLDGIKLDIEGAEYAVIPTLSNVIRRFRPRIVFELHSASKDQQHALLANLRSLGYDTTSLQQSEHQGAPLILATPSIIASEA